ncbi:endonuclease/exonuclease/phosphatase family protein-like protein [Sarocladium strictum]
MLKSLCLLFLAAAAQAESIHAINGKKFLSPFSAQSVTNVTGIVTAKGSTGLYLRSPKPACDARIGNGLFVYDSALGKNESIATGDTLVLSGKVTDYRSTATYLFTTELEAPVVQSHVKGSRTPKPRVIGKDTLNPPTEQYSSLDNGDIFGVPNDVSRISEVNPELQPDKNGLDFWKSLDGELVTITNPVAISKVTTYGEVWMVGSWPTTGRNERGGLTLGNKDGNPEAIIIGTPLDGSSKASSTLRIGDTFEDITGVVHYQFGFYYLLPLTKIVKVSSATPDLPPPTKLISTGECSGITFGDYNVENFAPSDTAHVRDVAAHIVNYLKSPDVLIIQEIQDNSGRTNDGVVDSSVTLQTLASAISSIGGPSYSYAVINPANGQDGGQPGGNIRVAYLYNPLAVQLRDGTAGGSGDANVVLKGDNGLPTLKYNPGLIDPSNAAWAATRKPLVAEWQTVIGNHVFFTVNVHWSSKGGSSSLMGDSRPPINSPIEKRNQQANVTASFIAEILDKDADARIIMAGDLNEYSYVQPFRTLTSISSMLDLDEAINLPATERYTYTFGADMEELDHMLVSPAIADLSPQGEHIHVNTWVSISDQVSDHDPTVAKLNVCGTWYRGGGSPATYTATPNADGVTFTLSTSKGKCAIIADTSLSCAASVASASSFGFDGLFLTYSGSNVFYASVVPSGTTATTVFTGSQAVTLQMQWNPLS